MRRALSSWFLIVSRSMREHRLSTSITVGAGALASGLVMAVFAIHAATSDAFSGSSSDYDAILGPPGGQGQLVLNTLFHLDASQGNLPWSMYEGTARSTPGSAAMASYMDQGRVPWDASRWKRVLSTSCPCPPGGPRIAS